MVDTEDETSRGDFCASPLPIPTSQPFLFRQYTIREFITPTKDGILALKEESFKISGKIAKSAKRRKFNPVCEELKESTGINQHARKKKIFKEQKAKSLHWKYVMVISMLPLLLSLCITYFLTQIFENEVTGKQQNLAKLAVALNGEVLGQEDPIRYLLNILDIFLKKNIIEEVMPVILMTGASGVGKSLASSIIARHFPPPGKTELIYVFPPPLPENIIEKFSTSGFNLIVVDSLSPDSILDAIKWSQSLFNEAMLQNKPVILALVFNVQEYDQFSIEENYISHSNNLWMKGEALRTTFQSAGFESYHLAFNLLTVEHIQECIRRDLRKQGAHIDDIEKHVQEISKDINTMHNGCKSVWSKTSSVSFG